MKKEIRFEASVACADMLNLGAELKKLESAGIDLLHMDIMDGTFVPNFCLDFSISKAVNKATTIPQGYHLMIEKPERYISTLLDLGAKYISIHVEACIHVQKTLKQIKEGGAMAGLALNPSTPIEFLNYITDDVDMVTIMTVNPGFAGQALVPATLRKISDVRDLFAKNNKQVEIQVDGNVSYANIPPMVKAGATMLVGGTSSLFRNEISIEEAAIKVRQLIAESL